MNRAFFMARQPVKTPGAKEAPKEEVKATTTAQASTEDALDAVLGKPETSTPVANKTAEDALAEILSGEDSVEASQVEQPEGFIPAEQFDAVAAELEATKKALALATKNQGKAVEPKVQIKAVEVAEDKPKKRTSVLGPKGWMIVEE